MDNQIIIFIKKLWTESIVPTIQSINQKNKENSERIERAIKNKQNATDISVNNPEDFVQPLVEAQNATTEAVKGIIIPEPIPTDLSSLESKLEDVLEAIKNQELVVNQGDTKVNVDMHPFLMAIEKLKNSIPKLAKQEITDYTKMFSKMIEIMERPKDDTHHKMMMEVMGRMAKTEDIAILAEYLQTLIDKPNPEFPDFPRDEKGIPYFHPTKVGGGGGGGLTSIESVALQGVATAENQLLSLENQVKTNIEAGGKISVGTSPVEVTFAGATKSITITADKDNTGLLFVGKLDVTSAGDNSLTYLECGDSITLDYNDATNAIYVVSDTASQYFWKGAIS